MREIFFNDETTVVLVTGIFCNIMTAVQKNSNFSMLYITDVSLNNKMKNAIFLHINSWIFVIQIFFWGKKTQELFLELFFLLVHVYIVNKEGLTKVLKLILLLEIS